MNCRDIDRRMLHYIDRDLPHDITTGIEDHLQKCVVCNKKLDVIKRIYSSIDSDQVTDDYPFFLTRVEAKLQKIRTVEQSPLFRVKPVALLVAIVLPLLAGIWLGYSAFRQDTTYINSNELIADVNNYLSTPGYPEEYYYSDSGTY